MHKLRVAARLIEFIIFPKVESKQGGNFSTNHVDVGGTSEPFFHFIRSFRQTRNFRLVTPNPFAPKS